MNSVKHDAHKVKLTEPENKKQDVHEIVVNDQRKRKQDVLEVELNKPAKNGEASNAAESRMDCAAFVKVCEYNYLSSA